MLGTGKGEGRPKGDTYQPEKFLEDGRVGIERQFANRGKQVDNT